MLPLEWSTDARSRREEELARYLRLEYGSPETGWFLSDMQRELSKRHTSSGRHWVRRLLSSLKRMASGLMRTPVRLKPVPRPVVVHAVSATAEEHSAVVVHCPEGVCCGS